MDSVQTEFPEYSAKDVKAIFAAFRTRMVRQEKKEERRKEMEAKKSKEK